jgi:hypothetical protein
MGWGSSPHITLGTRRAHGTDVIGTGVSMAVQVMYTRVERDIMTRVRHPFLVDLKCSFQTSSKVGTVDTLLDDNR